MLNLPDCPKLSPFLIFTLNVTLMLLLGGFLLYLPPIFTFAPGSIDPSLYSITNKDGVSFIVLSLPPVK